MARNLFFITVSGVVLYVAAVLLLVATGAGEDPRHVETPAAVEQPISVAASH